MTREVWCSPQPSEGNEKPSTRSSETRRELTPSYFGKRREFLSRELLYLLVGLHLNLKKIEESSLLVHMDRAPPSLQKQRISFRPHPQQEESFLQCNEKEEGPISSKDRQAPPTSRERRKLCAVYRSVGKKRPPFSLGKVSR